MNNRSAESIIQQLSKVEILKYNSLKKNLLRANKFTSVSFLLLFVIFALATINLNAHFLNLPFSLFYVVGILIVLLFTSLFITYLLQKKISYQFTDLIIKKVKNTLHPNWNYFPDKHLDKSIYKSSQIFEGHYSSISGAHLTEGDLHNISFSASILSISYMRDQHLSSNDGVESERAYIFKGLYFCMETLHKSNQNIYIHTKSSFDSTNETLEQFFSSKSSVKKVKQLHPYVSIYADNESSSNSQLNDEFLSKLVKLQNRIGCDILISMQQNKIYCAVKDFEMISEFRLTAQGFSEQNIKRAFNYFNLISEIATLLTPFTNNKK